MAENTWVTGVITLLLGVITPLITARGPPCINVSLAKVGNASSNYSCSGDMLVFRGVPELQVGVRQAVGSFLH